jgi:head-tail adaptor
MITADHLLNTTVVLWRREMTPDEQGGQESAWEQVGELPARISQPPPGELQIEGAQVTRDLTHRVYVQAGTDIVRGDRIVTTTGLVLRVESVIDPSEPAYRRAQCVLTQDGR